MTRLYTYFTKALQVVLLILSLHWVGIAVSSLAGIGSAWYGSILATGLVAFFMCRFPLFWQKSYHFFVRHKLGLIVTLTAFQLLLLVSAQLLIRRDAAVVFLGAFEISKPLSIASYLTRNPNNLPLFLYERAFYNWFGTSALWILQGINILATNMTAGILYRGSLHFWGQKRADLIFLFYTGLLVASPFFMAMYTDMLSLPFIALQFFLALGLVESSQEVKPILGKGFLLGLVTALAYFFRPTVLVTVLALFMILFFTKKWKKILLAGSGLVLGFGLVYAPIQYGIKHQDQVELVKGEGLAKTPLLFINLGLTFSGTDQEDMKEGLKAYLDPEVREEYNNGMFAQENVKKEIVRRIKAYNPWTFFQHTVYKQSMTVADGTLNWIYYENLEKEKTPYVSPLYKSIGSQPFFSGIRHFFISRDRPEFAFYAWVKQSIWIVLAWGVFLASRRYAGGSAQQQVIMLAVFGGFLFLQVFEGGKSRYLIQFLPQILALSSLGWIKEESNEEL